MLLAEQGFQVITFDTPGAYRSSRPIRCDMAEMLESAIEALGSHPVPVFRECRRSQHGRAVRLRLCDRIPWICGTAGVDLRMLRFPGRLPLEHPAQLASLAA